MCAGAVVLARVARLVFGAYDPKAGAELVESTEGEIKAVRRRYSAY